MQQMLTNLRARREDERGFTLIELMVVVLIIAILIAIAIPTFLGAKTRAQDKAAQSSLRNALTNAKGIYTDTDTYTSATVAALQAAEPSLAFAAAGTASTGPKSVSVWTSAQGIVLTSLSASGDCWVIGDGSNGPGTLFAKNTGTACSGTATEGVALMADPSTVAAPGSATNSTGTQNAWVAAW